MGRKTLDTDATGVGSAAGAGGGGGGDESTFGAHVGAGIEFIDAFVEAVYIIGFTEGESTGHVAFRIGYGINLGG